MALKKVLAPVIPDRTCRTCGRDITAMPEGHYRCDLCHRDLLERLEPGIWRERELGDYERIGEAPPYRGDHPFWMSSEDMWDLLYAFTCDAGDR